MTNNLKIFVLILFLITVNVQAQMHKAKLSQGAQDSLSLTFKKVLTNDGYKQHTLTWNRKRVIGVACIVTFGALAYYCHQQAESSYSDYLRSGSIAQMDACFRKAEKYDRLKGAASIGIEFGFLLSAWSFF